MGGHGGGVKAPDPAIERFNQLRESAHLRFSWTRGNTRAALLGFIIFPAAVYFLASDQHNKWTFTGRRKGESLRVNPASTVSESE